MAVTNNVLNAINVFSSTSVFNSNKGSVGANDLNFIKQTTAELATEGGGIIAQSLGTNGYVKFANGLILQWGYATGPGSPWTITFPITFSSAESYAANSTPAYTESLGSQYCFKNASWTNTSITVFSSNKTTFRTYWFAIGK